jgi:hypothetical protein
LLINNVTARKYCSDDINKKQGLIANPVAGSAAFHRWKKICFPGPFANSASQFAQVTGEHVAW